MRGPAGLGVQDQRDHGETAAVSTPKVVVFDVNETMSDLTPMGQRFVDVGAPEWMAKIWFASLLRDGFALTASGTTEGFSTIGEGALRSVLDGATLTRDREAAIEHIMGGFLELPLHPDVPGGVRALSASGVRLVTLSNGSTEVAERLFCRRRDPRPVRTALVGRRCWRVEAGCWRLRVRSTGLRS